MKTAQNYFFVKKKESNSFVKVKCNDILYFEASGNYVIVVTEKESYHALIPLGQVERLVEGNSFCRIHNSFIVSIDHIDSFTHDFVMINKRVIPIGKLYKNRLRENVTVLLRDTEDINAVKNVRNYLEQEKIKL